MYMDYFNARFKTVLAETPEQALRAHEERCHWQLKILLDKSMVICCRGGPL